MAVVWARKAVSHFDVGSDKASPPMTLVPNMYAAGDYVDRSRHASWSTEKAVVTGRQAVNALAIDLGLDSAGVRADVIPAPEDTPQLTILRLVARAARNLPLAPKLPIPPPWSLPRWATKQRRS
ncbi:hypothetical protein TrLO_g386 [Triparma laevis f. longispina]|uniref:Uncharacterized protein n=1 Tax=Triparma laevis f. longispina TaxID=1714387 RepID=A0A9W7FAR7_9STRA|nr:hypothetical protein TrLO_g386 [Triparma laevis f. longispina]